MWGVIYDKGIDIITSKGSLEMPDDDGMIAQTSSLSKDNHTILIEGYTDNESCFISPRLLVPERKTPRTRDG